MQFSITVPANNKISEISKKAPSKSPVMPPKIFRQILDQIIRLKTKIAGIIIELFRQNRIIKIIEKKKLSRFFLSVPSITARPPDLAKGRLFKINAMPKRE